MTKEPKKNPKAQTELTDEELDGVAGGVKPDLGDDTSDNSHVAINFDTNPNPTFPTIRFRHTKRPDWVSDALLNLPKGGKMSQCFRATIRIQDSPEVASFPKVRASRYAIQHGQI
jgi:hypothetical protein